MNLHKKMEDLNKAFAYLKNKEARWWRYFVSHSSFEILLGDSRGQDNLIVGLKACDYISGPVEWENQNLKIYRDKKFKIATNQYISGPGEWEKQALSYDEKFNRGTRYIILEDDKVGFRAECGLFGWEKNYDLLEYGSFLFPGDGK